MATSHRLRVGITAAAAAIAALGWLGCGRDQSEPTAPHNEQISPARSTLQPDLGAAIAVKDRHAARLLKTHGVVGVAVGRASDGRAAVVILTTAPGIARLPANLDGIPVVVQVTGALVALPLQAPQAGAHGRGLARSEFTHPVPIGVSTSNVTANNSTDRCATGTIAARVTDGTNVYALSANHLYALTNSAATGTAVVQPGLADDDCVIDGVTYVNDPDGPNDGGDVIGHLSDFQPIAFCFGTPPPTCPDNTIDAAIASSSTSDLGTATPSNGYGTPSSATTTASIGQRVEKYGRTTALTKGRVFAIDATVMVDYGGGQTAKFVHQIVILGGGFSKAGDSGSLVVAVDGLKPVGLLFAGGVNATIANPIGDILTAFGVTIDGT